MALSKIDAVNTGGQSGFFNKYPYTDFHELNLDFLLSSYSSIIQHLNDTVDWINNHEEQYEEAIARLTDVENEIDGFEAEIDARFDKLQNDITAEVDALIDDTKAELEQTKAQIKREVAAAIAEMKVEFDNLYNTVKNDIAAMKVEIQQAIFNLQNLIAANNDYVFEEVTRRLNEFIQNLPDYENLIVYNPVFGTQTNVQQAILDLYDMFRIYGITAAQYDSLQLTALQYDNLGLTALEYDRAAYKILNYPDPTYSMRDPFDGQFVKCQVVIYKLAELHRNALTAAEYDDLELTAYEYDALELTAYLYDWYGIVLFGDALTAEEYDALELTATEYDSKRLDAYQYDVYGKLLLAS